MSEESSKERMLIRRVDELAVKLSGPHRIVGDIVDASLVIAKSSILESIDLDVLVQEGKRIQNHGNPMAPENIRAFKLFLRAAQGGHSEGQYQVSMCLSFGIGVVSNSPESDEWLRRAAEQGHVEAQSMLGTYRSKTDIERAKWLRKAAEQGESDAQCGLASCYWSGRGVLRDYCEAYAWFQLGAGAPTDFPRETPMYWGDKEAAALASSMSSAEFERARALCRAYQERYSVKE